MTQQRRGLRKSRGQMFGVVSCWLEETWPELRFRTESPRKSPEWSTKERGCFEHHQIRRATVPHHARTGHLRPDHSPYPFPWTPPIPKESATTLSAKGAQEKGKKLNSSTLLSTTFQPVVIQSLSQLFATL